MVWLEKGFDEVRLPCASTEPFRILTNHSSSISSCSTAHTTELQLSTELHCSLHWPWDGKISLLRSPPASCPETWGSLETSSASAGSMTAPNTLGAVPHGVCHACCLPGESVAQCSETFAEGQLPTELAQAAERCWQQSSQNSTGWEYSWAVDGSFLFLAWEE